MAKCYNCDKPAMFAHGTQNIPLCLDCSNKLQQTLSQQQADLERETNFMADEMESFAGIGRMGARYPARPQPIIVQGGTYNNTKVTGSTTGMINTGQLSQLDTAISVIGQHGDPELVQAIRKLADLIVGDRAMSAQGKKEAVEILSVLIAEATAEPA
jgi:hypothetical protein